MQTEPTTNHCEMTVAYLKLGLVLSLGLGSEVEINRTSGVSGPSTKV